jgi:hypothetical protein
MMMDELNFDEMFRTKKDFDTSHFGVQGCPGNYCFGHACLNKNKPF